MALNLNETSVVADMWNSNATNSTYEPQSPQSNTTSNMTVEEILLLHLGPRRNKLSTTVVLTIIYCLILVTGVVGNTCTCIVIIKNNYMHTATNYYLFSLAISDVLTLILALPPELFSIWQSYPWIFGKPFCYFKTFVSEMTYAASILTITAFTVERYIAICHPIKAQMISNLSRAVKVILLVWVIACISASPYMRYVDEFHAVRFDGEPLKESLTCNIPKESFADVVPLFQISAFLFFVTPMCIITVLYILIGITLKRSGLSRRASDDRTSSSTIQSRRAVLKMLVSTSTESKEDTPMARDQGSIREKPVFSSGGQTGGKKSLHAYLVAVVVAFFICWAPFHTQRLLTIYLPPEVYTESFTAAYTHFFYVSGTLYFVSSTVNPILYNLMSRKYREAFKMTLCCCFYSKEALRMGRRRKYMIGRTSSHYSSYTQSTRIPGSSLRGNTGKNNNLQDRGVKDPLRKNLVQQGGAAEKSYSTVNNGSIKGGACPDIKITDPRGCDVTPRDRARKDSKRGDKSLNATVYFPRHQIIVGNSKKPGSFV